MGSLYEVFHPEEIQISGIYGMCKFRRSMTGTYGVDLRNYEKICKIYEVIIFVHVTEGLLERKNPSPM